MKYIKEFIRWLIHQGSALGGHAVGVVILGGIGALLKSYKSDISFSALIDNPKELLSPVILAVSIIFSITLLSVIVRQRSALRNFGVRLFSHHDSGEGRKADWGQICEDIREADAEHGELWLLGANGRETFSSPDAPLNELLKKFNGPIRILLMYPYSAAFTKRVTDLNVSDTNYCDEILDSIVFCQNLNSRHGRKIELRLYHCLPIWKMIMTGRVLWIQHYRPQNHVDHGPMYCFEHRANSSGLFDAFRTTFERHWQNDHSTPVDLGAFKRNDWQTCIQYERRKSSLRSA